MQWIIDIFIDIFIPMTKTEKIIKNANKTIKKNGSLTYFIFPTVLPINLLVLFLKQHIWLWMYRIFYNQYEIWVSSKLRIDPNPSFILSGVTQFTISHPAVTATRSIAISTQRVFRYWVPGWREGFGSPSLIHRDLIGHSRH